MNSGVERKTEIDIDSLDLSAKLHLLPHAEIFYIGKVTDKCSCGCCIREARRSRHSSSGASWGTSGSLSSSSTLA